MDEKEQIHEMNRSLRDSKRELEQAQLRIRKLDGIIQHLYEDNLEGKISDERFIKMSENYEAEQQALEGRVTELKTQIAAEKEGRANTGICGSHQRENGIAAFHDYAEYFRD